MRVVMRGLCVLSVVVFGRVPVPEAPMPEAAVDAVVVRAACLSDGVDT